MCRNWFSVAVVLVLFSLSQQLAVGQPPPGNEPQPGDYDVTINAEGYVDNVLKKSGDTDEVIPYDSPADLLYYSEVEITNNTDASKKFSVLWTIYNDTYSFSSGWTPTIASEDSDSESAFGEKWDATGTWTGATVVKVDHENNGQYVLLKRHFYTFVDGGPPGGGGGM